MAEPRDPLPLGFIAAPWGKLAAVQCVEGERYYHFVRDDGSVSMIDAHTAESWADNYDYDFNRLAEDAGI